MFGGPIYKTVIICLGVLVAETFVNITIKREEAVMVDAGIGSVFRVVANITNHFHFEDETIYIKFLPGSGFKPDPANGKILKHEQNGSKVKRFFEELDMALSNNMDWSYTIEYSEYFSHLPSSFVNVNRGHYKLRTEAKEIHSVHEADFMFGSVLTTQHLLTFHEESETETTVKERLEYECPMSLTMLCYLEVETQRPKVLGRIRDWDYNS